MKIHKTPAERLIREIPGALPYNMTVYLILVLKVFLQNSPFNRATTPAFQTGNMDWLFGGPVPGCLGTEACSGLKNEKLGNTSVEVNLPRAWSGQLERASCGVNVVID
jgi:hypothetical protein